MAQAILSISVEEPADGPHNMAEDRRWLEEAETTAAPLTRVRLYRWDPPTASIGRHQTPESALALDVCVLEGVPVVRRPTGGRAVFHDSSELTYSVVSNSTMLAGAGGITETYRRIAAVLRAGLKVVGAETRLARVGGSVRDAGPERRQPCFASASRHELLWSGRKIAGSAQCRLRRAVLQHGSIPVTIDYARMARILGSREGFLRQRMVSVSEAAGHPVAVEELAEALIQAFESWFDVGLA